MEEYSIVVNTKGALTVDPPFARGCFITQGQRSNGDTVSLPHTVCPTRGAPGYTNLIGNYSCVPVSH